jgi:2-(1,2-epoxy-1,2-dihydrophenyl)acetyl-CoA isomerase
VSDATTEDLLIHQDGPVLSITLNRPRSKNALTGDMARQITDAVARASLDDQTRVVVLRGHGSDFCSGMDLAQSNRPDRDAPVDSARTKPRVGHLQRGLQVGAHRMIEGLVTAQVPIVAGVQGWAAGIGNTLALTADIVIAATSAKFWVPFATKGFTPDSGNTWLLPRLVGLARAKEMVMRGKPIDGQKAAAWGLVSECVPDDQLDAAVDEVVTELAGAATVAVSLSKMLLHRNLEVGLAAAMQNESIFEELAVRSDDFKEGMRAFVQKRDPSYTGW